MAVEAASAASVASAASASEGAGLRERREEALLESLADDSVTYHLLRRLCPYFHGRHHLEEIMWRVHLDRKTIHLVISTYSEYLVTVKHPAETGELPSLI